mgnify:CR=1 FL=1
MIIVSLFVNLVLICETMKEQNEFIIQIIKGLLKQHKLTYSHVATHLSLSEASVKRMFSTGHITLNRLLSICSMMDLEVQDLLRIIQLKSKIIGELSWEQESLIVSDNKYLLVTVCTCNHWTFDEIFKVYNFTEAELVSYLLKLEQIQLLELKVNNKIVLKISPNFSWIKNGPVQNYFESQIQPDFLKTSFTGPGELRILLTGMLSPDSNEVIQKKIKQLAMTYNQLADKDKYKAMHQRFGTSCLLALRPWELQQFSALRRLPNNKPFDVNA